MSEMPTDKAEKWLRDRALKCEGATEHFPWGHTAIKVKGKMFLILSGEKGKGEFSVTAKLPVSGTRMLDLPYCQPTGYGMGKHGWVSATWQHGERVPMDVIEPWIEESYRAVLEAKSAKKKVGAKSGVKRKAAVKVKAGAAANGAVKSNGAKSKGSSAATKRVKAKGAGEKSNATHARAPQRGPRTPRGRKTGRAARGV
jgi:predicted DNA-binding protein (MmcQ/YjbR family)